MDQKDNFIELLQKLDNYATYYQKDKRFLILFKIAPGTSQMVLRVYNGDCIWIQQIDEKSIDQMRKKSEVQGTYQSYCDLLLSSFEDNLYTIQEEGIDLKIVFQFKLARDVFLKGQLEMGGGMIITNDDEIRKVQSDFTFDLFMAMKQTRQKQIEDKSLKTQKQTNNQLIPQINQSQQVESKRKVNGDIVMPNMKKRKGVGVKLQ